MRTLLALGDGCGFKSGASDNLRPLRRSRAVEIVLWNSYLDFVVFIANNINCFKRVPYGMAVKYTSDIRLQ